jgi:hypothetical protein
MTRRVGRSELTASLPRDSSQQPEAANYSLLAPVGASIRIGPQVALTCPQPRRYIPASF